MGSNLGLSEWAAGPAERRQAFACAGACVLAAVAVTPVAGVALPRSFPLLAMILAASIMATAITGLLLFFQARALRSSPTGVLATGFFFVSATMVPYAITYPGLFQPLADVISASPATSGLLWFSWHAGFLAAFVAFAMLRRRTGDVRPAARIVVVAFVAVYLVYTSVAIWADGMPVTYDGRHWTWLFLAGMAPVVVALAVAVVIGALRRPGEATVLDLWLGVVGVAMLTDVYLTVAGSARFTVGWYASRIVMLFATTAVLGVLLRHTAQMYAALVARAEILESEAHTDTLTGLPNRRRFDEAFARAFGSTRRRNGSLAIAIVDIDRFKLYNDAFGHQAGDEALHAIGGAIADSVRRSGDFAARYGGEEFVVVLEDTTLEGAVGVAESIRGAIEATGLRAPGGGPLTVSAGVAVRAPGDTAESLLHHADEALYLAKDAGRDRVVAWKAGDRAISE